MPRTVVAPAVKCGIKGGYKNKAGGPCGAWPVPGLDGCYIHAGVTKEKALAKGQLRIAVAQLAPGVAYADPYETSMRILTAGRERVDLIAELVERARDAAAVDDGDGVLDALHQAGIGAFVVKTYASGLHGPIVIGEAVSALADLEMRLWKLVSDLSLNIIKTDFEGRRTAVAERLTPVQGMQIIKVLRLFVARLGLDVNSPDVKDAILWAIGEVREEQV